MKILVVRVGRVGDTVMMTPALSEIIQYYPDAEITLLTSPVGKHLLNNFHPNITSIWSWQRSGLFKPYIDKSRIRKRLKKTHFDKIFCFDVSPRIAGLFSEVTGDFYWNQHQTTTEIKHCAKIFLDFVAEACNKPALPLYNTLSVDDKARVETENELANIGINKDDILIMFHPTFSGFSKSSFRKKQARLRKLWPVKNYGELAKKLSQLSLEDGRTPKTLMVLLPDEISYGEEIVASSGGIIKLLKSQSTFERYKAMLKRADLLITPDSGPMHVASALGTKIIAFFSMKDPGDCGPYMPAENFTILRTEETATPDKGVAAIDVDTVFNACKTILSNQEKV
jgi:ADP-heptose:LPS heptosyltransferase